MLNDKEIGHFESLLQVEKPLIFCLRDGNIKNLTEHEYLTGKIELKEEIVQDHLYRRCFLKLCSDFNLNL